MLKRLSTIKPPKHISRTPRSFALKKWKANEWRVWFFHYSIPCCLGIIQSEVLNHWALLVEAISRLSKSEIRINSDIPIARSFLQKFCKNFPKIYGKALELLRTIRLIGFKKKILIETLLFLLFLGESNYGINVHYLTHLVDYVELHGALPENSMFPYESYNGYFASHSHGNRTIIFSAMRQLLANQTLQRKATLTNQPKYKQFCARLKRQRYSSIFFSISSLL